MPTLPYPGGRLDPGPSPTRGANLLTRKLGAVLPGTAALLAAWTCVWLLDDAVLGTVTSRYALVLYGAGAILAVVFHRSRVAVALLGLGFVESAVPLAPAAGDPFVPLATTLVAVMGGLALMRDRGLRSRAGAAQLGAGAGVTYLGWATFQDPQAVQAFFAIQLLPTGVLEGSPIPQATLMIGLASILAAVYGIFRWRGPVEIALLWTQAILLMAMHPSLSPPESGILLMACGLVLASSVLEQSYSMAYRDELTGLPGRRALMEDLEEIHGTFTLAMVDVDHFKRFNDRHGHDVGDQVLQLVAARLASGPGGGKAYRYGGEEFTLVYPGRTREDAQPHAEAVRDAVERASFSLRSWNRPRKKPPSTESKEARTKEKVRKRGSKKLSVTVSVGLADTTDADPSAEGVLKRADEALYRAKSDGRNRVSF